MDPGPRLAISYVLPLRWQDTGPVRELSRYLNSLCGSVAQVILVDGSPPPVYAAVGEACPRQVQHVPPDPAHCGAMGKVPGVLTGLELADHDRIVIADDDVRWERPELRRVAALLTDWEVVRPQNYFSALPWHARLDTARSLLNRVWSGDPDLGPGDFPGTLGVRLGFLRRCRGYDGDSLFENLELMRTVLANGGRVNTPLDLYVARRPPKTAHFLSQRVRQAYDDFAIPRRMAAWLGLVPIASGLALTGTYTPLAIAAAGAIVVAEVGRRRAGGASYFPLSASLLAPVWLAERAVCSWLALRDRLLRGGVVYGDSRLRRSSRTMSELRTLAGAPSGDP